MQPRDPGRGGRGCPGPLPERSAQPGGPPCAARLVRNVAGRERGGAPAVLRGPGPAPPLRASEPGLRGNGAHRYYTKMLQNLLSAPVGVRSGHL